MDPEYPDVLPPVEVLAPFSRVYREARIIDLDPISQRYYVKFPSNPNTQLLPCPTSTEDVPFPTSEPHNTSLTTSEPGTPKPPTQPSSPTPSTEYTYNEEEWVPISCVFLRTEDAQHVALQGYRPQVGDVVEVYSLEQTGWAGWWECGIVALHPDTHSATVEFPDASSETVPTSRLRPASTRTRPTLTKHVIPIPQAFRLDTIETSASLARLTASLGALLVQVSLPDASAFEVVAPPAMAETIRHAVDMHMHRVRQLARSMRLRRALVGRLEAMQQILGRAHVCLRFEVNNDVVGSCIGRGGANLRRAKEVEGVLDVRIGERRETTTEISIVAETEGQAEVAREVLEFVRAQIPVSHDVVGLVIGKKGVHLRGIERRTGVSKFVLLEQGGEDEEDGGERDAVFETVGPRKSVEMAVSLLNIRRMQVKTHRDLEAAALRLREQMNDMPLEHGAINASKEIRAPPTSPLTNRTDQDSDSAQSDESSKDLTQDSPDGSKEMATPTLPLTNQTNDHWKECRKYLA